MIRSLYTIALLGGIAAALPAPSPAVTPPARLYRRQDEGPNAEGCTITSEPEATYENTVLGTDGSGGIITSTQTYTIPAGLGCNCNDGVIAGVYSTVGNDGRTTQYCATGVDVDNPTGAQSTTVPEATPGAADNPGWAEVQCDEGSLSDIFNNPWEQWNDSGAAGAWNSLKGAWDAAPDEQKGSLSNFMGNYFKTKPKTSCEILGNPNCEGSITCGQNFEGNSAVTTPAGYVLFNSFVGLHMLFEDMKNGIDEALTKVLGRVGTFVETLSPINEDIEDQKRLKLALDAAQAATFGLLAPTFHTGFSRSKWVQANPNWAATGIDVSYGMVGTGMAIAKDKMDALSTLPVQNEMSTSVVEAGKQWLQVISDIAEGVLNDPDRAFEFIGKLLNAKDHSRRYDSCANGSLDQGKFFAPDQGAMDPVDASGFVEKALLASQLSAVWVTGSDKHPPPVIITAEGMPQDGSGCDGIDPEGYEYPEDTTSGKVTFLGEPLSQGWACVGDEGYWLMGGSIDKPGACVNPITGTPSQCVSKGVRFDELYGLDKLGDFNLTMTEVVGNAVNGWKAAGKKNNWDAVEIASAVPEDVGDLITQNLAHTQGIVKIPICSLTEMIKYFDETEGEGAAENPNHPCPP